MIAIPNSRYIVSGSEDKTIKIWNYEMKECVRTLFGHGNDVKSVIHIANSKFIASGSHD